MAEAVDVVGRAERFLRRLDLLSPRDRLVRVKSWRPTWDGRYLCWPTMLVDGLSHRSTVQPVWDRVRFRRLVHQILKDQDHGK